MDENKYKAAMDSFMAAGRIREEQLGLRGRETALCYLRACSQLRLPWGGQILWKRTVLRVAIDMLQDPENSDLLAACYNEMGKTYLPQSIGDRCQDYDTGVDTFQTALDHYTRAGIEPPGRVEALRGLGTCLHYLGNGWCRDWYQKAIAMSCRVHGPVSWQTFQCARDLWTAWPDSCTADKAAAADVMWTAFPYKAEANAVALWWAAGLREQQPARPDEYAPAEQVDRFEAALERIIAEEMRQQTHSVVIAYDPSDAVVKAMDRVGMQEHHRHVPSKSGTELKPGKVTSRIGTITKVIYGND